MTTPRTLAFFAAALLTTGALAADASAARAMSCSLADVGVLSLALLALLGVVRRRSVS